MTRFTAVFTAITFLFSLAVDSLSDQRPETVEVAVPAISIPVAVEAAASTVRTSTTPHITVVGADEVDRVVFDEALARFRDNGLELPDLEVHFLDEDDCRGYLGLFQKSFTPWRVLLCSDLAFVATHELAHAWEAANLDDAARDHYLEERGLTDWSDKDTPRSGRGEEDAAFVIQQNLMAGTTRLSSPSWQERLAAYELLTGDPSPLQPTPEPRPLAEIDFTAVADEVYDLIGGGPPT